MSSRLYDLGRAVEKLPDVGDLLLSIVTESKIERNEETDHFLRDVILKAWKKAGVTYTERNFYEPQGLCTLCDDKFPWNYRVVNTITGQDIDVPQAALHAMIEHDSTVFPSLEGSHQIDADRLEQVLYDTK